MEAILPSSSWKWHGKALLFGYLPSQLFLVISNLHILCFSSWPWREHRPQYFLPTLNSTSFGSIHISASNKPYSHSRAEKSLFSVPITSLIFVLFPPNSHTEGGFLSFLPHTCNFAFCLLLTCMKEKREIHTAFCTHLEMDFGHLSLLCSIWAWHEFWSARRAAWWV